MSSSIRYNPNVQNNGTNFLTRRELCDGRTNAAIKGCTSSKYDRIANLEYIQPFNEQGPLTDIYGRDSPNTGLPTTHNADFMNEGAYNSTSRSTLGFITDSALANSQGMYDTDVVENYNLSDGIRHMRELHTQASELKNKANNIHEKLNELHRMGTSVRTHLSDVYDMGKGFLGGATNESYKHTNIMATRGDFEEKFRRC
jgi:hypothetical protein